METELDRAWRELATRLVEATDQEIRQIALKRAELEEARRRLESSPGTVW